MQSKISYICIECEILRIMLSIMNIYTNSNFYSTSALHLKAGHLVSCSQSCHVSYVLVFVNVVSIDVCGFYISVWVLSGVG